LTQEADESIPPNASQPIHLLKEQNMKNPLFRIVVAVLLLAACDSTRVLAVQTTTPVKQGGGLPPICPPTGCVAK
jgi:hypothetical protein